MPWNYNDAEIEGIIDSNLKDAPPAAPMSNTAASVRSLLKTMWSAMRGQVTNAVNSIDAVNASLVARSLSLTATVYMDGTTGNDANTGATLGAPIKTLGRLAALHSGKTSNLIVQVANTIDVAENVFLSCMSVCFQLTGTGKLYFRKLPTDNGSYVLSMDVLCAQFLTQAGGQGILEAEGHSGNVAAEATNIYLGRQGCIRLFKNSANWWRSGNKLQSLDARTLTVNVGNNAVMFAGSEVGAQTGDYSRSSFLFTGNSYFQVALGTNSLLAAGFDAQRVVARTYTPTSSTDATVMDGEMVADSSYLYRKNGTTIKKIAWTAF